MEQPGVHKTFRYKLNPTPEQAWLLERTLMLCRHVYNAAIGERREAWRMRGVSVTYYQQKAELPGIKEAMPEAHQMVRRQRQDFHYKTALQLVRQYDTIYHEDLQVRNMVRNHHLAKSISDAGWAAFLSILTYKAACAGRQVIAVHPAFTSQRCSGCGIMVLKGLSVRWHSCPDCGTSLHRDHNAARNIERAGQVRQGGVALAASEN
jgi:IS605 OrfB family transposase